MEVILVVIQVPGVTDGSILGKRQSQYWCSCEVVKSLTIVKVTVVTVSPVK